MCEKDSCDVVFIAYHKPHPLKDYIEFVIGIRHDGAERATPEHACTHMRNALQNLSDQLKTFSITKFSDSDKKRGGDGDHEDADEEEAEIAIDGESDGVQQHDEGCVQEGDSAADSVASNTGREVNISDGLAVITDDAIDIER